MPHAGTYVLACLISGVSAALILASGPSYTESRSPQGTPYNVNEGRSTYDGCRTGPCQIAYLNSVEDFCLWAPSHPALPATRGAEHTLVAWCMESIQGSRVIPDGTILGAHLVITPEYVQVTGVGKLTNINVPPDSVVSTSGRSYSDHQIVVTSVYGQLEQVSEWTSFVSQERFCFRACRPSAAASAACPQIHDIFGCSESVSGNYDTGVFEDCIVDGTEVPSALYQEILAAPSHRSARPFSHCTSRGTTGNAQIAHARRAIAPVLATSLSQSHLSLSHSTPVSSCMAPTTTDMPVPMTSSLFPTSNLNATSFMNFSVSSTNTSTFTMCSYNHSHTHTRSHWHTHTHRRSHHHSSTFSATSSSSSSYQLSSYSPSPRTASSLNDSSMSLASSFPTSSTPSFTSTSSTVYSSGPLSGTATSPVTPASTRLPTASLSSSSYGTSSSLPGPPTPPSSYGSLESPSTSSFSSAVSSSVSSSTSSSISSQSSYILTFTNPSLLSFPATSSSPVPPSMPSSTSSENSYVPTFTTPSLSYVPTTSLASSPFPVSPSTSSPPSSTSSQTPYVLSFTTPSSSVSTASATLSSPAVPNSQTQIGSQCPPLWNAGSVSSIPPPLTLAILMLVLSSSVDIVVF